MSNTHHVVPNPEGGWDVKRGGSERASGHFSTKKEAVDAGRVISRNQKTEFVIHRQDGTIERTEFVIHRQDGTIERKEG